MGRLVSGMATFPVETRVAETRIVCQTSGACCLCFGLWLEAWCRALSQSPTASSSLFAYDSPRTIEWPLRRNVLEADGSPVVNVWRWCRFGIMNPLKVAPLTASPLIRADDDAQCLHVQTPSRTWHCSATNFQLLMAVF